MFDQDFTQLKADLASGDYVPEDFGARLADLEEQQKVIQGQMVISATFTYDGNVFNGPVMCRSILTQK